MSVKVFNLTFVIFSAAIHAKTKNECIYAGSKSYALQHAFLKFSEKFRFQ